MYVCRSENTHCIFCNDSANIESSIVFASGMYFYFCLGFFY